MAEGSILNENGISAIASVIINRAYSEEFPNTITEVIYQPRQFSCINDGGLFKWETSGNVKNCVADALYYDYSEGSLFFLNPQLAIEQGYENNVISMFSTYQITIQEDSVVFMK